MIAVKLVWLGASSVEHNRFTQHNFKALLNTVKFVIFRPPSSLHFIIVDFFILCCLYFQMNLKIILLTSSVKPFGVSSTLQTNVSFDNASVLTLLIVLHVHEIMLSPSVVMLSP